MNIKQRCSEIIGKLDALAAEMADSSAELTSAAAEELHAIDLRVGRLVGVGYGDSSNYNSEIDSISEFMPNPKIVFDVGGNFGYWTQAALVKWPEAKIVCYEPQSGFRKTIQDIAAQSSGRVTFRPVALSDQRGSLELYRDFEGSGLASLHKRDLTRWAIPFEDKETVEVVTLRDEMDALGIDQIDVLKIDVEGHELQVLKGLGDRLNSVSLVQFEFGGTMIDSRSFLRDFYNVLEPAGLGKLYRIAPGSPLELGRYTERHERFDFSNYIAVRG